MCGIIGAVSSLMLSVNTDKFLKSALICDTLRGPHSTGVVQCNKEDGKNIVRHYKKAVDGYTFVDQVYDPTTDNSGTFGVIGHNRYATIGNVNDQNAHPFMEKKIIGVHNGSLTGDWRKDLEVSKRLEVDSRGLMRSIATRGPEWTFKRARGGIASVWFDLTNSRTFVYRNTGRPLYYAISHTTVYYASEAGMLSWLLSRHKITLKQETKIEEFKPYMLYDITGGEVKEVRKMEQPPVIHHPMKSNVVPWDDWKHGSPQGSAFDKEEDDAPPFNGANRNTTGRYYPPVGLTQPSGLELYGFEKADSFRNGYAHLPIMTPANFTKGQMYRIGYRLDNEVYFRRDAVTPFERRRGIIGEYVDRGTDTNVCDLDGDTIYDRWYESSLVMGSNGEVESPTILHPDNLEDWREFTGDWDTTFTLFIRSNIFRDGVVRPTDSGYQVIGLAT